MGGRIVSFASIEVERGSAVARVAEVVGGVTIFGLKELQPASLGRTGFIEAWRDAICLELGSEEFEKYCLTRR